MEEKKILDRYGIYFLAEYKKSKYLTFSIKLKVIYWYQLI